MAKTITDLEAAIIGAGISGIATACRLQMDLGLQNFKLFEKDTNFGGTWLQNQYPGCGCDIPTRLYSLSFAQRANWKRFFSMQSEILDYLLDVAETYHLPRKTHFRTACVSATFDERNAHWIVKTHDLATGTDHTYTARLLFSCVGALSVPRKCDVPGADTFKGDLFHSARWQHDVKVKDRNVVVLGNGCTASQIVPAIAPECKQLTQIVRAKHWYLPHFADPFGSGFFKWLQRNSSMWVALERYGVVLLCESHFLQAFKIDGKGARDRVAQRSIDYIKRCAPKEYQDMLIPKPGEVEVACKRRIFDSTYVPCLAADNVELTNDQAKEITEDGVILQSGRKLAADVIILANGFQTDQFAMQMDIINGDGLTLEQYWKNETGAPQAYRSELIAPFPNMFIIWGPNAVTGHFSAIWSQERAVEMAMRVVRPLFTTGDKKLTALQRSHGKTVRVKPEAEEQEQQHMQAQMKEMIYTTGCGSWYVDQATGRVTAVNASFQTTVAWRSKFPFFPDYDYRGLSPQSAWRAWPLMARIGSLLRLGATPKVYPHGYSRNIFLRFLLFPTTLLRYLLQRCGIRVLQGIALSLDTFFPYNKPMPMKPTSSKKTIKS